MLNFLKNHCCVCFFSHSFRCSLEPSNARDFADWVWSEVDWFVCVTFCYVGFPPKDRFFCWYIIVITFHHDRVCIKQLRSCGPAGLTKQSLKPRFAGPCYQASGVELVKVPHIRQISIAFFISMSNWRRNVLMHDTVLYCTWRGKLQSRCTVRRTVADEHAPVFQRWLCLVRLHPKRFQSHGGIKWALQAQQPIAIGDDRCTQLRSNRERWSQLRKAWRTFGILTPQA